MTEKPRSSQKTVAILMSIVLIAALVLSFSLYLQKNNLSNDLATAKKTAVTLQTDLDAAKKAADEATASTAALQTELDSLKAAAEAKDADLAAAQKAAEDAAASDAALQTELDSLKAAAEAKDADLAAAQKAADEATASVAALQTELDSQKAAAADASAQVSALETEKAGLATQVDVLTAEKATLEAAATDAQTQIAQLNKKVTGLDAEVAGLKAATPEVKEVSFYTAAVVVKGAAGPIQVVVTVDESGAVLSLAVGTNADFAEVDAAAKVKEEAFTSQFIGKTGPFKVGEGIEAVADAAEVSQTVVDAVNAALALLGK